VGVTRLKGSACCPAAVAAGDGWRGRAAAWRWRSCAFMRSRSHSRRIDASADAVSFAVAPGWAKFCTYGRRDAASMRSIARVSMRIEMAKSRRSSMLAAVGAVLQHAKRCSTGGRPTTEGKEDCLPARNW